MDNKKKQVRVLGNPRLTIASFRVNDKEYQAIKDRFGGMAGLRDYVLYELLKVEVRRGSGNKLN